jgi:osmotically-inducible protein OsmY
MSIERNITQQVVEELEWEPSVEAAGIRMAASNGAVTLQGIVRSYAEKMAAERAAKRVQDVRSVANELEVRLPLSQRRRDAEISEAVARILQWNVQVPRDVIQVRVADAWVQLEGTVEWHYQRTAVLDAVERMVGIRGVSNLIAVRPRTQAKDIKSRIDAALRRRADLAALDAQHVTVGTRGDTVVLRGQVHSWADRALVEAAAWGAPGVAAVDDELEVVADELELGLR